MDIENKFEIIANHHQKLLTRYHSIGTTIASLTADSCIDAKEYWRDGKYLYLLYSMKGGVRKNVIAGWNWGKQYIEGFPTENPFDVERFPESRQPRYIPPLDDFWKVVKVAESEQDRLMS